ncbi:CHAP domain-containing protein [Sphaerisporangium sp. NPDC049003]|uniref:CHAP domain-containing protein n=1 Tax=Sphaerisporangium sp. NPDC049003 TaxID=3364517 RepID=UPI00371F4313
MTTKPDQRLVEIIRGELGYRERASDHWTKFGAWYEQTKPAPGFAEGAWCQMLISWAADKAGIPQTVIPRMAYTPAAAMWFKARGRLGHEPRPYALVFFDWGGSRSDPNKIDHVGIVTAVLSDGRFRTLEGNTSNQLQEHTRSTFGAFFAYPDYAAAATDPTEVLLSKLPLIKPGAEGWHAKTIFYLLKARGFGKYLDDTRLDPTRYTGEVVACVVRLQKSEGLKPDGEVGEKTWPKLLGL